LSTLFTPITTANLTWKNGVPYATKYGDIYFSLDNGLQEARHVFIEGNRLIERWQALSSKSNTRFHIGETGFGTGLNFLLTWSLWEKFAPPTARLHYISCEQHPLSLADLRQCLALWPELSFYTESLLAAYPVLTPGFHSVELSDGRVTLHLMLGDVLECYRERLLCGDAILEQALRSDFIDAWYLDGFSPQKNPDMWSEEVFTVLSQLSKKGTTLSTFSVAGFVRKNLSAAGFDVKQQKGYGRKREMVVAEWQELPSYQLKRKTPWHISNHLSSYNKKAIIVGAGLAGVCVANSLAKRGWQVSILDAQSGVGLGASGNRHGIVFPMLSAYRSPLTEFMLMAFLFASRFYPQYLNKSGLGDFSGLLQFVRQKKRGHANFLKWLSAYPALGVWVDKVRASELSGVECALDALFIPNTGWVDSPGLCKRLIQHPGIQFFPTTAVQTLNYDEGQWSVAGHKAPVVVIASGYQANQFLQTHFLPIQPIPGQMTGIESSAKSRDLKIPLCGEGHILPSHHGFHAIGATFGAEQSDKTNDELNFEKILHFPVDLNLSFKVSGCWKGIRGTTLDHLPFVGPVPDLSLFSKQYASLALDPNRWVPCGGDYWHGLFIAAGFGSRGLTTIPLCAEYLAGMINGDPSCLPRHLMQLLSAARLKSV